MIFKVKIIRLLGIVGAMLLASSCSSDNHSHKQPASESRISATHIEKTISQAPIHPPVLPIIKTVEEDPSLAELEGKITNKYGIRDDILRYIENTVPADNEKAKTAAIKMMQYDNQIHYHATNQKEALKLISDFSLALACLRRAWPKGWDNLSEVTIKFMRDTHAREKRIWDIDTGYFGWQVIGTGLTSDGEDKKCAKGEF